MAAPINAVASRVSTLAASFMFQQFRVWRNFTQAAPSPDTLLLSDRAVQQIKKVCHDGSRLRIAVEGGGCSGFQYLFSLDSPGTEPKADDVCISYMGVSVAVDTSSLDLVRGATVDYNTELIKSAFRITNNPKAEQGCSCGSSFAVKE